MRNEEDLSGNSKQCRQDSVGSVAGDPDILENSNGAEREAQGTQGFRRHCTSRESVSPLSRLTGSFRNKYY